MMVYKMYSANISQVAIINKNKDDCNNTFADPEGGTRGPDPLWNLKILPKSYFGIFGGLDPPPRL